MSTSFGLCEQVLGSTENSFYNSLWSQAASQGITAFISSGDNGAAGCDTPSSTKAKSGLAVNGLCSTPFSVCVGGTQFNDTANPGLYWSSTNNSTTKQSVLGVIPEIAWNESGAVSGGSGLWASSGGVSTLYAKPSWQVAPGVPADGMRDVPDVSLSAASHDGYAVCQADVGGTCASGSFLGVGGTSASSPSFAGLMALVVQKTGFRQGNANTIFYPMANAQYGSSGTAVFRDITSGSNLVPNFPSGTIGYNTTTAYDRVTGLGSVDAAAMVNNWGGATAPDFGVSASPTDVTIQAGASGPSTITTTVIGGFNAAIALSASGQPAGVTVGFSPASISVPGSGTSTMTITVGAGAALGTTAITVTATGGAITHTTTVNLTVGKALAAVSVTPNSGSGLTQTFSFQFSDANGYNAITETQTIINGSLTYTGGCVTWFSRATNAVALLNDAGTSWGTSVVIGTNTTLQNSQCSLNVGASSVSGSGNTFTENLAITFAAGFTGTKNIYASVAASGGLDSGWQTLGTWTPAALIATPPAAVSVTPSSGSGLTQTFSFQFSDVNGYSTITETQTIINGSLTYAGCVTWFNRATNAVALLNDAGTSWGTSVVIGTNTTLQNSQCSLNVGASSVSGSGNTLTENLAITFAAGFTGTKNVYAYVAAAGGLDSGWQTLGTWTPAALIATPPAAVSVTPSSGSGLTQTFSFQFSDVNGYGTITETQTIINGSLTYAGCVTWFNRATNAVALLNDAGTSWGTSVVIGTNTTLQNSQCSLNVGASSVSGSSNTLTENLAITFAAGFNGTKNVYAYVAASGGLDSGWHTLGTWVVP